MVIEEQIKMIGVKSNISLSEMARRLNKSPQAFNQQIKRGKLTIDDLNDIALISGCQLECSFVFPDGYKIDVEKGE